jgi:hypothetical protein
VRELVDEHHIGSVFEHRGGVEVLERRTAILHRAWRDGGDREGLVTRGVAPVTLHPADHDLFVG